jgi:multidrug efflux pump
MPEAGPDSMAATVATPLERHLGIIADVTEMTSESTIGSTRITLQFSLNRSLDGAARDVEAAINSARADLPASLRQNPTYRKVNPADAPVAILALTSEMLTRGQIYDAASKFMQRALSQIEGVGEVQVSGSSLPAVRVELNPLALSKYGIGFEDVRAALASANAHSPKGAIEDSGRSLQIYTNDRANHAEDYRPVVIAYRDGAPVRLTDVAVVEDSVENARNEGLANGRPAVVVVVRRQPSANIIDTVEHVKAVLPQLEASLPKAINVELILDRTTTIRSSLHDVQGTLLIAVCLVILQRITGRRNPLRCSLTAEESARPGSDRCSSRCPRAG